MNKARMILKIDQMICKLYNMILWLYSIETTSLLFLDRQEEFKLRWQFLLWIETVRKVYPSNSTIGVNSDSQGFDVVTSIGPTRKVRKIELYLIPSLIQSHRHSTYKWFDSGGRLIIRSSKSASYILIIKYLHLKGKIFLELYENMLTFLIIMTRNGSLIPNVSL